MKNIHSTKISCHWAPGSHKRHHPAASEPTGDGKEQPGVLLKVTAPQPSEGRGKGDRGWESRAERNPSQQELVLPAQRSAARNVQPFPATQQGNAPRPRARAAPAPAQPRSSK